MPDREQYKEQGVAGVVFLMLLILGFSINYKQVSLNTCITA